MSQCCKHVHVNGPIQTLDEMAWERGIWGAAHGGDLDKICLLLNRGKYVNEKDNSGYTALHYAARANHVDVCEELLKHGADVNAVTKEGKATPLHRAALAGNEVVTNLLLEKGADCNMTDSDGKTALHRAAEGQYSSICEKLISLNCAILSQPDNRGHLPWEYAKNRELVLLLSEGQHHVPYDIMH